MYEQFCWREKRCHIFTNTFPYFVNSGKTTLPTGNAHYSIYGLCEEDAKQYASLLTNKHMIYTHYSSEIIVDAETKIALDAVIKACLAREWSFEVYNTGSGGGGGHVAIQRDAKPSELLYLRDKCFVIQYFSHIADIDTGIYSPMHILRGIGKVHEKTGRYKHLVFQNEGTVLPSVEGIDIPEMLMRSYENSKYGVVENVCSSWTKIQQAVLRQMPEIVKRGGRHVCLWVLSKDLFKSGLDHTTVLSIALLANSLFEEPKDYDAVDKAVNQASTAYGRS